MFSVEAKRIRFYLASAEWYAFLQLLLAIGKKARQGTQVAVARKEAAEEEF